MLYAIISYMGLMGQMGEIVDSFWNALDSRYAPMLMFYYLKKEVSTVFLDFFYFYVYP